MEAEAAETKAVRVNITLKPETYARLQEVRERPGAQINVSQVADAAINAELDRMEKPGIAGLVARLRVESDRRRGVRYRQGYTEGERWARDVASWAEICDLAGMNESDVRIQDVQWTRKSDGSELGWVPGFVGRFRAPDQDYGAWRPRNTQGYTRYGAPAFAYTESNPDDPVWVTDIHECDEYWRGWLGAVKHVFDLVNSELEPIRPQQEREIDPDDVPSLLDDNPPEPEPDPDDIPF